MTDAGIMAVPPPSGRTRRAARLPRRRIGILLASVALATVCGVAEVLSQGSPGPVVRTVMVGPLPYDSLTVDEQTGRAFVFNRGDNSLSVLDTHSGALVRTVQVGSGFAWLAASARTGHVFLMSGGDGTISMLDGRSGAVLRTVSDSDMDTRQLVVDEGTNQVFVGHRDSPTVTVLDARTGAILRHLAVCQGPFALGMSARTGHLFAKCNDDGTTDMVDARTGRVLHRNPTNSGQYCGVLVDESTNRVVETGNGLPDLLDALTGRLVRRWPATVNLCLSAAVDTRRGWIYTFLAPAGSAQSSGYGGSTNQVVVLDGRTGAILRRFPALTNADALALDSQTGRLLVGSVGTVNSSGIPITSGMVSVLDAATGRVLRTVQVGFNPSDIAIDTLRRRALVVSSYTDIDGNDTEIPWRPRESWWPQVLRRIKQVICCLPFQAPAPPAPTTDGTVTTIDLSRL